MTTKRKAFVGVLMVGAAMALTGCMGQSGDGEVGGPEDYQYKGKVDPLMSASASDRATQLSERFKLIQARQ